jgi:hypothetical protein
MVTLHAAKFETSMEDPIEFARLTRRFDPEHVGDYSRN